MLKRAIYLILLHSLALLPPAMSSMCPLTFQATYSVPVSMQPLSPLPPQYNQNSQNPRIEETAELAGVSIRTLQNNLKENQVVYRELTSRVRFEEAKRLLLEGKMYVNEIAAYLGYNDTSNFNHAFKKWTGVTPKNFVETSPASD
jgi:AraC-like DNA-binding protein